MITWRYLWRSYQDIWKYYLGLPTPKCLIVERVRSKFRFIENFLTLPMLLSTRYLMLFQKLFDSEYLRRHSAKNPYKLQITPEKESLQKFPKLYLRRNILIPAALQLWRPRFTILKSFCTPLALTVPIPDEEKKINLNFYFHTFLWCHKRFEGLKGFHKTFWNNIKKCENENLS